MIVLEGIDGAGKSLLAQQLSSALNIAVHHSGGPPKSFEEIINRQVVMTQNLSRGFLLIYDRAPCISDPIYGSVIRGKTPFDDHPELGPAMRDHLIIPIIYCRPPTEKLLEVISTRQEAKKNYKPLEHMDGVKANYLCILKKYDLNIGYYPHWTYDWTGTTESPSLQELIDRIKRGLSLTELIG